MGKIMDVNINNPVMTRFGAMNYNIDVRFSEEK